MTTRHPPLMRTAVLAVGLVLLLTETSMAQRVLRGRRGRRMAVAPAQVYYYRLWLPGNTAWYWAPVAPSADRVEPLVAPYSVDEDRAEADTTPPPEDTYSAFRVLLPSADAELWLNGKRTQSSGTVRQLQAPAGESAAHGHFVLKAQWSEDGRVVTDTRGVDSYPGDRITVDFTRPNPTGTAVEVVPNEVPIPGGPPAPRRPASGRP